MRLINVRTGDIENHATPPPYAILSHRWEDQEVTLQDYTQHTARKWYGYRKIQSFLRKVQQHCESIDYAWVDTCCIDKTSSAELSEAINSMFRWYQDAEGGCFVYLCDVDALEDLDKSAWFKRGWTLQELIAPEDVRFYNKHWNFLGSKQVIYEKLGLITGIEIAVLRNEKDVLDCSVAQRMSWAANRHTTRIEDRAYSLMGLFEVNMPMLYGEGEKSFYRLQQEIIRESDDHSIFAWTSPHCLASETMDVGDRSDPRQMYSLLSRSVDLFASCQNIVPCHPMIRRLPYFHTNVGLTINLFLLPWTMYVYIGILNCADESDDKPRRWCIFLHRLGEKEQYARVTVDGRDMVLLNADQIQQLYRQVPSVPKEGVSVRVRPRLRGLMWNPSHYGFRLRELETENGAIPSEHIVIHKRYQDVKTHSNLCLMPEGESGTVATIVLKHLLDLRKVIYIRLGFGFNFEPVVLITMETAVDSDPTGFLRPSDPQFRAENGCRLHNWLKEVVENDGKYFKDKKETLVIQFLGRPDYTSVGSEAIKVNLWKDHTKFANGKACWCIGITVYPTALLRGLRLMDPNGIFRGLKDLNST